MLQGSLLDVSASRATLYSCLARVPPVRIPTSSKEMFPWSARKEKKICWTPLSRYIIHHLRPRRELSHPHPLSVQETAVPHRTTSYKRYRLKHPSGSVPLPIPPPPPLISQIDRLNKRNRQNKMSRRGLKWELQRGREKKICPWKNEDHPGPKTR